MRYFIGIMLVLCMTPLWGFSTKLQQKKTKFTRFVITYSQLRPIKSGVTPQDCINNYGESYQFSTRGDAFKNALTHVSHFKHHSSVKNGIAYYSGTGIAAGHYYGKKTESKFYAASVQLASQSTATGVFHDGYCEGHYTFTAVAPTAR